MAVKKTNNPTRFTITDAENFVPPVYSGTLQGAKQYANMKSGYRKRLRLLRPDLAQSITDTVELIITDTETGEALKA